VVDAGAHGRRGREQQHASSRSQSAAAPADKPGEDERENMCSHDAGEAS
jgi:hypothetical protein